MDDESNLVPVFIPPLAMLLAMEEKAKNRPLSEAEVISVRDEGYCIMMPPAEADEMEKNRAYHDVEPENCWADWHRLRTSMTGNGLLPRIILCVPGTADLLKLAQPLLDADGIEHEWRARDDNLLAAFMACARGNDPTLDRADFQNIAGHTNVLYVLSKPLKPHEAPALSRQFLQLAGRLLAVGGLGEWPHPPAAFPFTTIDPVNHTSKSSARHEACKTGRSS